ncbi:hypothetical protein GCK72_007057 [Caenorhabditis remanei]|uniref:Uncharacterized protein n=1 Tax=Caenorhabditis remanei TaxID=31234 RepID=E3M0Y9_CAERE|nr:hypothetical protein GCK72_007057 [Caenorhabditis remanei]EFO89032.1 hypothetical protein CRE_06289 [Caenorhabditis remanei]KAF1767099.1 hypothetical protein GCK72_007057 [Caenorhabditis remanei]
MKLGKPTDIQKTPSRGCLGMIARLLQSLTSARKPKSSVTKLEVEVWDEYPPIDTASTIADGFKYAIRLDRLCDRAIRDLEDWDYSYITSDTPKTEWNREEPKERFDRLMESSYDVYDLIAEREAIAKNSNIA